jgi:hypothetical protein
MSLVDPPAPQNFAANTLRRNRFGAAYEPKFVATHWHDDTGANPYPSSRGAIRRLDLYFVEDYAWLASAPCAAPSVMTRTARLSVGPEEARNLHQPVLQRMMSWDDWT